MSLNLQRLHNTRVMILCCGPYSSLLILTLLGFLCPHLSSPPFWSRTFVGIIMSPLLGNFLKKLWFLILCLLFLFLLCSPKGMLVFVWCGHFVFLLYCGVIVNGFFVFSAIVLGCLFPSCCYCLIQMQEMGFCIFAIFLGDLRLYWCRSWQWSYVSKKSNWWKLTYIWAGITNFSLFVCCLMVFLIVLGKDFYYHNDVWFC